MTSMTAPVPSVVALPAWPEPLSALATVDTSALIGAAVALLALVAGSAVARAFAAQREQQPKRHAVTVSRAAAARAA
jgi:hypothetical protein